MTASILPIHHVPAPTSPRTAGGSATPGDFAGALRTALATPAPGGPAPAPAAGSAPGVTLGQMLQAWSGGTPALTAVAAPATRPAVAPPAPVTNASKAVVGGRVRPLPGEVGSGFGPRVHPVHGDVRAHAGVDIGAPTGTPIRAASAGTVVFAGERGGYGNLVIVDHGGGVTTRYAHAQRFDVAVGAVVEAGQVIARVGATGTATGPHLHFEVRHDGVAVDPQAHGWW